MCGATYGITLARIPTFQEPAAEPIERPEQQAIEFAPAGIIERRSELLAFTGTLAAHSRCQRIRRRCGGRRWHIRRAVRSSWQSWRRGCNFEGPKPVAATHRRLEGSQDRPAVPSRQDGSVVLDFLSGSNPAGWPLAPGAGRSFDLRTPQPRTRRQRGRVEALRQDRRVFHGPGAGARLTPHQVGEPRQKRGYSAPGLVPPEPVARGDRRQARCCAPKRSVSWQSCADSWEPTLAPFWPQASAYNRRSKCHRRKVE